MTIKLTNFNLIEHDLTMIFIDYGLVEPYTPPSPPAPNPNT
ncbi:MAG TPA: hypothetical protein PK246_05190 [Saprospiraceae bacterium]|nr:hypothetical protein [Saprospiraceae bacterium]